MTVLFFLYLSEASKNEQLLISFIIVYRIRGNCGRSYLPRKACPQLTQLNIFKSKRERVICRLRKRSTKINIGDSNSIDKAIYRKYHFLPGTGTL